MPARLAITPRLMPAPAAAAYIGVSETRLRELGIPRRVLGARRLYERADLDDYIDSLPYEGQEEVNSCDEAWKR